MLDHYWASLSEQHTVDWCHICHIVIDVIFVMARPQFVHANLAADFNLSARADSYTYSLAPRPNLVHTSLSVQHCAWYWKWSTLWLVLGLGPRLLYHELNHVWSFPMRGLLPGYCACIFTCIMQLKLDLCRGWLQNHCISFTFSAIFEQPVLSVVGKFRQFADIMHASFWVVLTPSLSHINFAVMAINLHFCCHLSFSVHCQGRSIFVNNALICNLCGQPKHNNGVHAVIS